MTTNSQRLLWPLCLAFGFVALLHHLAAADDRPNVLLIMIDDLRPALGCYGDPRAITPNMDRFANSARVFGRAYCQQAVCGPSRTSILTGRLPDETRVWHNRNHFRTAHSDLVTLPQLFKNNGYHSQSLGKIFSGNEQELDPKSWSSPEVLRLQGWQNYLLPQNSKPGKQAPFEFADVSDDAYPDGKLAELAIETLKQLREKRQPYFLAVGFFKPHLPFNAPMKYLKMHPQENFSEFVSLGRTVGAPPEAYPDHLELGGYRGVPKDEQVDAQQALDLRRAYYACVTYTDAQVGKVLGGLEDLGLDRNTIVVIMGDHGFSLGEADHWCKDTNFESDTHVPLMIRTPGMQQPGIATSAMTQYVDVYPTLAELAGLEPPSELAGRSLVPILRDAQSPGREFVLSQFSRPFKPSDPKVMGYSVRTNNARYTRWINWLTREVIAEELYDYLAPESVASQPGSHVEKMNVVDVPAYEPRLRRLRLLLDSVLESK